MKRLQLLLTLAEDLRDLYLRKLTRENNLAEKHSFQETLPLRKTTKED